MKKTVILVAVLCVLGAGVLHAQESIEQFLRELEKPGKDDYVKLIYEGSHENKLWAINKLVEMGAKDDDVIDALVFGLQQGTLYVERQNGKVVNDFWDVRAASAVALGDIGNPRVLPKLYQALRYDPDVFVRSSVVIGIGKMGRRESIPEITRTIETSSPAGPDDQLVLACVQALGTIGHRDGFIPLVEVMRGKFRRSIKIAARDALKKIKW